ENDIANALLILDQRSREQDLANDLGRAQMTFESRDARGAEDAAHRAADLARDALRDGGRGLARVFIEGLLVDSVGIEALEHRDKDGLDLFFIGEREEELPRLIARLMRL